VVRVKDDTGTPLEGVSVIAWRARSDEGASATSDAAGVARFASNREDPIWRFLLSGFGIVDLEVTVASELTSYDLVVTRSVRVTFRLLDADGDPIERAILRVEPQPTAHTMMRCTDADGRVTVSIPARGDVSVRFDGEVSGREEMLLEAQADGVPASSGEVVLRCRPVSTGKSMSVRVLAADGTPVAGATVGLAAWNRRTRIPDATTGPDGVARFVNLVGREVRVRVTPEPGRAEPREVRAVPDGQEVVARFPAVRVVEGEVVWESGGSAAGAWVMALRDGKQVMNVVADAAGRFRFEVPADDPGPYGLQIGARRGDTSAREALGAVRPGDAIRVVLRPR
jgi:hypothetical protein